MTYFDGNEGAIVNTKAAVPLTRAYSQQASEAQPAFKAQFFGKNMIQKLLDDCGAECAGIRIYNAADANGTTGFVLVGVTADGTDMHENMMLADGPTCPPNCTADSPLGA